MAFAVRSFLGSNEFEFRRCVIPTSPLFLCALETVRSCQKLQPYQLRVHQPDVIQPERRTAAALFIAMPPQTSHVCARSQGYNDFLLDGTIFTMWAWAEAI